jgi:alkylation response protein AidB-like acyl-CoA dehydrogenase
VSEPELGSDSFRAPEIQLTCRAHPDGDDFIVNGQKSRWVTNGTIATHGLVCLGFEPEGNCIAIVPFDLPGISKGIPWDKHGKRGMDQGEIFFDDVRLPGRYVLFSGSAYPAGLDWTMSFGNTVMGCIYTGVARAGYEAAVGHARERVQSGRPIIEHQLVHAKLFDMFARVETARAYSRAALKYVLTTPQPAVHFANVAKIRATEAAYRNAYDAVQIHGARGLSKGSFTERLHRNARMSTIEDCTSDVIRLMGARSLYGVGKEGEPDQPAHA